jgi:hypothetical protein
MFEVLATRAAQARVIGGQRLPNSFGVGFRFGDNNSATGTAPMVAGDASLVERVRPNLVTVTLPSQPDVAMAEKKLDLHISNHWRLVDNRWRLRL